VAVFYCLEHYPDRDPLMGETEFLPTRTARYGPAPMCAQCGKCIGLLAWLPPYDVELTCRGRTWGDVVFGVGEDFLVSDRFRNMYESAGLTGLEGFDRINVAETKRRRKTFGEPPVYYDVRVALGPAAMDWVASGAVWDRPPDCTQCNIPVGLKRFKRTILQPNSWTGEDIFIPRGASMYVVTERFRELCREYAIKNAVFVRAEKYWIDSYPWENFEKANEMMRSATGAGLLERITSDGTILRYEPKTNYMVIANADRSVREIFRPVDGMEFFRQYEPE
jgi:hypothetical protein